MWWCLSLILRLMTAGYDLGEAVVRNPKALAWPLALSVKILPWIPRDSVLLLHLPWPLRYLPGSSAPAQCL